MMKNDDRKEGNEQVWELINAHAGGIDVGADEIWVCAREGDEEEKVRSFPAFTVDMKRAVAWLIECGVTTVAMEATGNYWFTLHDLLEEAGIEVYVVNGGQVGNIPKKTDVVDCAWLKRLHTYGLLRSSFQPDIKIRDLRSMVRRRKKLIEIRARHINQMMKALEDMNVKLRMVLSDVTGVTGRAIMQAIVAGETDPLTLARFRHANCHYSEADFVKALTGNYRTVPLFQLEQALRLYDLYGEELAHCDELIEELYQGFESRPTTNPTPPTTTRQRRKNQPHFDVRQQLYRIYGVDLVEIDGLDALTAQTVCSEIGTDMSCWPTVKHFCSWLGLSPNNRQTGKWVKSRRTTKNNNQAAQALRVSAQSLARSQSYLGDYYRLRKAKHGPAKAITATAHKLARIIYFMLVRQTPYAPPDLTQVKEARREKAVRRLQKQAQKLGLTLTPPPPESDVSTAS